MNDSLEAGLRGTIRGQAERIRKLEDSVTCWSVYAIGMTVTAVILFALYLSHMQQHQLP
jgi:hypothetical protein